MNKEREKERMEEREVERNKTKKITNIEDGKERKRLTVG